MNNDKMKLDEFFWWLRGAFFFNENFEIDKEKAQVILAKINYCSLYTMRDERLMQVKVYCDLICDGMDSKTFTEKIKNEIHKPRKEATR